MVYPCLGDIRYKRRVTHPLYSTQRKVQEGQKTIRFRDEHKKSRITGTINTREDHH